MAWKPDPEIAKEKLDKTLEMVKERVKNLTGSKEWQQYLEFQAQFHKYSFGNVILIMIQRPDATWVAGYKTWQKLGRHVKRGEKGITILAPCYLKKTKKVKTVDPETGEEKVEEREIQVTVFRCVTVFDVSQTEGENLPEVTHVLTGDDTQDLFDALKAFAERNGAVVKFEACGNIGGYYDLTSRTIAINSERERNHQTHTLAHEIAHMLLHSDCTAREDLDRTDRELEAESVSYIVLRAFGVDSGQYSFGYLAEWSQGKDFEERIRALGERIQKAARNIIDGISSQSSQEEDAA